MAKKGHSEEEILRVLREAESGGTVVEVCRKHGISQQSFYLWKKNYSGLGLSELRELRQLREENNKLKSKRPRNLSITHKLHSDHDPQFYVGEPRHASPDHGVSRWGIVSASEIAA
jgi:putative transposase